MKRTVLRTILSCAFMSFTQMASAQAVEDFAYTATLELQAGNALYEIVLGEEAYAAISRPDLGDLRAFNGAGERLAYAVLKADAPSPASRAPVAVPFFPLYVSADPETADVRMQIDKGTDGSLSARMSTHSTVDVPRLNGYLVDLSRFKEPVEALRLAWTTEAQGTHSKLTIAASEDLSAWRSLAVDAPLIRLRQGDAVLERNTVEFVATRAKYLRLGWSGDQAPLKLTQVEVRYGKAHREPARTWKAFAAKPGEKEGEYLFDVGAATPIDRIRLELPQKNSIVPVSIWARASERERWRPLTSFVAYRLGEPAAEAETPELSIAAPARYWLLKTDMRSGGVGQGSPILHAGWTPHRIVFNARGEGPFSLALGNPRVTPGALSPDTLIPGYGSKDAYVLASARMGAVQANTGTTVEGKLRQRLGLDREVDLKKMVLWSALAAAVLLIAFMAWRLLRQMPRDAS